MTESIRQDIHLPHPPERVWTALTDPALIAKWLMPNDFAPRLGHRFTFQTDPIPAANFDGIVRCEVVEVEPPRRLAYTWTGGKLDTVVTYRLEPEGGGTRLLFEHSGFDLSRPNDRLAYDGMSGGWRKLAQGLPRAIEELVGSGR